MKKFTWFNVTSLTLRFCVFISADGDFGDLFFQRLQAGHGLGGVFYQMVWASCLQNEAFLDAAWVTLKVGFMSSTLATVLGTMAAYVSGARRPVLGAHVCFPA